MTTTDGFRQELEGGESSQPLKEGDVVARVPVDNVETRAPVDLVVAQLDDQLTPLYNTRTGEEVRIPRFNVPYALRKVHNDPDYPSWIGKPLFSRTPPPGITYQLGNVRCWLHPEHPDHAYYRSILGPGMRTCRYNHGPSEFEMQTHVRNRHRHEWEMIQQAKERARQDASQEMQRAMVEALQQALKEQQASPTPLLSATCKDCDEVFVDKTAIALAQQMKQHRREVHGKGPTS